MVTPSPKIELIEWPYLIKKILNMIYFYLVQELEGWGLIYRQPIRLLYLIAIGIHKWTCKRKIELIELDKRVRSGSIG